MKTVGKSLAVVTNGRRILTFRQPAYPQIGVMLPGGTVEVGEDPAATARRELWEEAGLEGLKPGRTSPVQRFDMRPYRNEVHERTFVWFETDDAREVWRHYEQHPGTDLEPDLLQFEWKNAVLDAGLDLCQGSALLNPDAPSAFIRGVDRDWSEFLEISFECKKHRFSESIETLRLLRILRPDFPELPKSIQSNAINRVSLFIARIAAEQRSHEMLNFLDTWLRGHVASAGPIVLSSHDALKIEDGRFDEPVLLLGGKVSSDSIFYEANRLIRSHGYGFLLDEHVGIIQVRGHATAADSHRSFSISATPNVIYIDYTDDILQLSEAILHEACHNFLNDALSSRAVEIHDAQRYFSPWRGALRPASGFLHAYFVFSMVLQFLKSVRVSSALSSVRLDARIKLEETRLSHSISDLRALCSLLKVDWLTHLVYDNLNRALQN
ncbi:aKG-HExxH-type peptide beta-hydroxylase [Xanthobacter wiegelii]|uniref:aKG-HExxH-type peptide beta-hydroxylase n=1 Tax=Xanthobacter wiegelii TaxID=3119913 RepID=UPI0037298BC0